MVPLGRQSLVNRPPANCPGRGWSWPLTRPEGPRCGGRQERVRRASTQETLAGTKDFSLDVLRAKDRRVNQRVVDDL